MRNIFALLALACCAAAAAASDESSSCAASLDPCAERLWRRGGYAGKFDTRSSGHQVGLHFTALLNND